MPFRTLKLVGRIWTFLGQILHLLFPRLRSLHEGSTFPHWLSLMRHIPILPVYQTYTFLRSEFVYFVR